MTRSIRITANDIQKIVKHINSLEFHVHPTESAQFNGNLWNADTFASEGVYIRRGHANPTHTSYRIPIREAWVFLTGIQYMLELETRHMESMRLDPQPR